ncbi:MAG TPA: class I SAM-dependent methyltransferase [Candidatus Acidoferrum sp.]|nr:class I SAM-dependent methyltransferase [Candidatus Acidoferrum sp.]
MVAVGINDRHHAIVGWLRHFGLRPGHTVLEIGCGVGTVTRLLADAVGPSGSIMATDLSPKSIEAAKDRLSGFRNIQYAAGDVLEIAIDGVFDVIALPDVIEHIPIASHPQLFKRIAKWLAPRGFVLLNYPNPLYLQWLHEHKPEILQVIDQPVHADGLLASCYAAGLYLDFLQTYSIWTREGDYIVAVMKSLNLPRTFTTERKNSLLKRVRSRWVRLFWRDSVPPLDMGRHPRSLPAQLDTRSAARGTRP